MQADITTWEPIHQHQRPKPGTHRIWHNCGMVTTPPTRQSGIFQTGWITGPNMPPVGMMSSYSMPNTYTVICTLRQNVYWQNIAPTYGRQFHFRRYCPAHYNRFIRFGRRFHKGSVLRFRYRVGNPAFYRSSRLINTPLLSTGSRVLLSDRTVQY